MMPEATPTTNIAILNSTFQIGITLQTWTPDNTGPLFTALIGKGFTIQQPNPVQVTLGQAAPVAVKLKTTALGVDHATRRIGFVITNENTDPSRNIQEILDVLNSIGFPSSESIERIDMQGNIMIRVDGNASSVFTNAVKSEVITSATALFNRAVRCYGISIASMEPFTRGVSDSPFFLRLEPLLTDDNDTKIAAALIFATSNATTAIEFGRSLYDKLKQIINTLRT